MPHVHLGDVDTCLHHVPPFGIWTPQGKDYASLIFVFLGLDKKYVWKEGREGRKEKGRERRINYSKIN